MRFVLTHDATEFAARTERLLAAHIECNVLATVLMNVLDGAYRDTGTVFSYGVAEDDEVRFAAMRTPPHPLLASRLDADAADFVELWLRADPDVDRVTSVPETSRAIAAAWAAQTGGAAHCAIREAMHTLEEVRDPATPAPRGAPPCRCGRPFAAGRLDGRVRQRGRRRRVVAGGGDDRQPDGP